MVKKTALYIDTPFCIQKCLFGCPFYRGVGTKERISQWYKELLSKLDKIYEHIENIEFHELYLGGGNSTTISGEMWGEVFKKLPLSNIKYLLAETDLRTLSQEHINTWNDYNFKFVSLGVQSLDHKLLTSVGRKISHDDIDSQIKLLSNGFDGYVNMDLICGIAPGDMKFNIDKTMKEVYDIIKKYPNISFIDIHINDTMSSDDKIEYRRNIIPKLARVIDDTAWVKYNHTFDLQDCDLEFEAGFGCSGSNYRIANPNVDLNWIMRMSGCMSNSESGWIFYNVFDEAVATGRIRDYIKDIKEPFNIELHINTALEDLEYKSYEYQLKHRNLLGLDYYL